MPADKFNFRFSIFDFRTSLPWIAAALSGLLLVIGFPKPHLPGIAWIACLPLLMALATEKRLKRTFSWGYVCGAFFFAGNCYWFTTVMELYGHLASFLAVVVLILFVIIDSVFFGAFGLGVGWAARRSPGWALAASPFLWVAMELARTYLITGFPWNLLGYAVQASGVRQMASVTGVYGLSFLAVATSALTAWVLLPRPVRGTRKSETGNWTLETGNSKLETRIIPEGGPESPPTVTSSRFRFSIFAFPMSSFQFPVILPVVALSIWVVLLLAAQWGLSPPPATQGREVAILIQPNVPLDTDELENWAPWKDPTQLQRLIQFSVNAAEQELFPRVAAGGSRAIEDRKSQISNPPLLVWAENPAPFFFTRDPIFRTAVENMARQTHAFVITNTIVPLDAEENSITNTAIVLDPEGREIARYDKIHLVPFGEYVPWWALSGLVHKITSEVGNFVPGSRYPVAASPGGGIGVFICYEAIIPQLARKLVANGAGVLVNISNDAWYGDSAAAYQHLEMARLRAIENHRYLLRATNNGLTVVIDPYGRVGEELPRYQRLALPAHFDFETRRTFYTAHGDLFAWLAAAVGALMLAGGITNEKLEARS